MSALEIFNDSALYKCSLNNNNNYYYYPEHPHRRGCQTVHHLTAVFQVNMS